VKESESRAVSQTARLSPFMGHENNTAIDGNRQGFFAGAGLRDP
jgi:hypothetical protein